MTIDDLVDAGRTITISLPSGVRSPQTLTRANAQRLHQMLTAMKETGSRPEEIAYQAVHFTADLHYRQLNDSDKKAPADA